MPEIGFDNGRVGDKLLRGSMRDHPSLVEDIGLLGEAHDGLHHMLDQQNGDAGIADLADDRDDFDDFAGDESRHDLVEQQEFRFRRQRAGEFEALAPGNSQRFRRLIEHAAHADLLGDQGRPRQRIAPAPVAQVRADRDVLDHRQARRTAERSEMCASGQGGRWHGAPAR